MKRFLCAALVLALMAVPFASAGVGVQNIEVDGKPIIFATYTDYDERGYETNYVKLRDVAWALRDTPGRFAVDYDGSTRVIPGEEYVPAGDEMYGLSSGSTAEKYRAVITVNGEGCQLDAFLLRPEGSRDGNFCFKLRDLGAVIGFTVGWTAERGIYIETQ